MSPKVTIPSTIISFLIGALVALGIHQGSVSVSGVSLIFACFFMIFIIQWIVFIPSYIYSTEHYFDLTGSLTYLSVVLLAMLITIDISLRDILLTVLIWIWAGRLGSFLFSRVKRDGKDGRFDRMKLDFWWFLMTWTIQGLWVFLTSAMALAAITSSDKQAIDLFALIGSIVWISGFLMEVVADQQKSNFKLNPNNRDSFITSGLWSWSRHPNYFGEITLWIGIAIIAAPTISGWQSVAYISPIFIIFLLTRVSGVNLLEARGLKRWSGNSEYMAYLERTSVLIPLPPKK
jgi:steroid 5-alpha reductase family enzyme